MKALRLAVLSALLVILLVAPGYAGTSHYRSGGGYGHVSSYAHGQAGYHGPVRGGYYHHAYREGHEGYWRPYGYRPYVYGPGYYDYYGPYYGGPYAYFSPLPGFSIYLGF